MYCSNCGSEASGNFCSSCGHPLRQQEEAFTGDWSELLDYETLIRVPEVRELIGQYGARSRKRLDPEELFQLLDKVGVPVPMSDIAAVAQPISEGLGFKTRGSDSRFFQQPPGCVLVAVLCALARNGQPVEQVHQGEDRCVIQSALPATLWSLKGDLRITVGRETDGTRVDAQSLFRGQIFDWGNSRRCLRQIFSEVEQVVTTLAV